MIESGCLRRRWEALDDASVRRSAVMP
jgi:hypothetical protein